jgi:glycerophosphoryl diester phosphodiesterase
MGRIIIFTVLFMTNACNMNAQIKVEIQGHRGARGLYPENTLPAFEAAQRMGVDVLELDIVVTKDRQLIVSHEPWLSATICMDTAGNIINRNEEKNWNIYEMTAASVQLANCGIKPHAAFPQQQKMNAYKPLLTEVFEQTERLIKEQGFKRVGYNIEIKSLPEGDNLFHPEPAEFSKLVYETIENSDISWQYVTIQSFDFRVLKYWHEHYPNVSLVALVENRKSVDDNLADLGFKPEVYSPHFQLINKSTIEWLQSEDIKVIPWTVNEVTDMQKVIKMGVDGIITDYPDRLLDLTKRH